MSIPLLRNIPNLDFNFEGLNRHSHLMSRFFKSDISEEELKARKWFLHTIVSACRHYSNARGLVEKQEAANQERDGGVILYIFDVSEHLESCITAVFRATSAVHGISKDSSLSSKFKGEYSVELGKLRKMRNQFDHMHNQIVSGQTGAGPVMVSYNEEGKILQFRSTKISTKELSGLLNELYLVGCSFFPKFERFSPPEPGGPPVLKMSVTISNKEK